jgi:PKD repeat protein
MKKLLSIAIAGLMLFTACDKELLNGEGPKPVAAFTFLNADCEASCTVEFINNSTDATHYFWDFGDNGFSTEKNPSYEYKLAGEYDVLLVASGLGGVDSLTQKITIKQGNTLNPYFISFTIDTASFEAISPEATRSAENNTRSIILKGNSILNANPEFQIYLEESLIGFNDGLSVHFYNQSAPQQYINYTDADGNVYSSANDSEGIYLVFSNLSYAIDGEVIATFYGVLRNSSGDQLNISSGSLKLKFSN